MPLLTRREGVNDDFDRFVNGVIDRGWSVYSDEAGELRIVVLRGEKAEWTFVYAPDASGRGRLHPLGEGWTVTETFQRVGRTP